MILELKRTTTPQGQATYFVTLDGLLLPGSTCTDLGDAMYYYEYAKKKHSTKDETVTLVREEI